MSDVPSKSQLLIYRSDDGTIKIDVRFENETVWLTQQLMAELFQTTKQNVGQHLKNVFEEGELLEASVVKKFFTTAADGKKYTTNFYNLDAIISVGYRVKSRVATQFRIWATQRLREYIAKELEEIEEEAAATDAALKKVLERIGARTALSARIENVSQLPDKAVRAPLSRTP